MQKNIMGRNYTGSERNEKVSGGIGTAELTRPLNLDGSEEAELTQPQIGEEIAEQENDEGGITPEDIAGMTPEEFSDYISNRPAPVDDADAAVRESSDEADPAEEILSGETDSAPYRTFNTQEEYEADRKKAVEEAFRKRFGAAEGDADELNRIRKSARGSYRGSENPIQDMLDDIDTAAANKAGQSVEDYRKNLDENEAFEQWKAERAQAEQQRMQNERIITQWRADAERLKQIVPGFDFSEALRNPAFSSAIRNGDSVALAYMRMQNNSASAAPKRREIPQNVTSARRGTGGSSVNPATMPTTDYIAYINKQAGRKLL